jgi:hypothetical protein
LRLETIIADASAVNNTIDVSTAGNAASINYLTVAMLQDEDGDFTVVSDIMKSAVCGVRCAVCGVRCAVCGVRCAVCGVIFFILFFILPTL